MVSRNWRYSRVRGVIFLKKTTRREKLFHQSLCFRENRIWKFIKSSWIYIHLHLYIFYLFSYEEQLPVNNFFPPRIKLAKFKCTWWIFKLDFLQYESFSWKNFTLSFFFTSYTLSLSTQRSDPHSSSLSLSLSLSYAHTFDIILLYKPCTQRSATPAGHLCAWTARRS